MMRQVKEVIGKSLIAAVALAAGALFADEEYVYGYTWDYNIVGEGAEITGVDSKAYGDLKIPTHLGGKPVVSLGGNGLFRSNSGLMSVKIPDSVTNIGYAAFAYCSDLTSMTIPAGVKSIGKMAFFWCDELTSITIPDSVTSIGDRAFFGCAKLADADGFIIIHNILFGYNGDGGYLIIPDGVTRIDTLAFDLRRNQITGVEIPDSVTSLAANAFYGCSHMTVAKIGSGVTSIGDDVFEDCTSLKSVVVPGNCSIGAGAFADGVTIYKRLTVSFDANGGTVSPETKVVMHEDLYGELPVPSRKEHDFKGWKWEETEIKSDSTVTASKDHVLVAQWEAHRYMVTFDANGGIVSPTYKMVAYDASYDELPVPTRTGEGYTYVFDGWFTMADGGSRVISTTKVTTTAAQTLYAHWIANPDIPPPSVAAVELETDFKQKQSPQGALVDASGNIAGSVQMTVGKMNSSGKVKITASVVLMNGKKVNAKALTLDVSGGVRTGKLVFKGIGEMNFKLADDGTFTLENGGYAMAGGAVGGNLPNGLMTFRINMDSLPTVDKGFSILEDLLPNGVTFNVTGGKKLDAGKAASPKYTKTKDANGVVQYVLSGLDDPKKPNISGLKLTYTPKTGLLKGSFKMYATNADVTPAGKSPKLKKYTVNVTGLVMDGKGVGEATMKKPAAGPWSVTVE